MLYHITNNWIATELEVYRLTPFFLTSKCPKIFIFQLKLNKPRMNWVDWTYKSYLMSINISILFIWIEIYLFFKPCYFGIFLYLYFPSIKDFPHDIYTSPTVTANSAADGLTGDFISRAKVLDVAAGAGECAEQVCIMFVLYHITF